MPLPTNYSRPSLPYQPLQSLPNDQRFVILTTLQQPPTAEMFDAELNAILDKINILAGAINGVVAGNIPGSDNPDNAGKFLVTDGAGNLSFIFVSSDNIAAGAISTLLLQDQAVIRAKIGNGAVGTLQLAEGAVNADILADGAVTGNKIPPGSLALSKLVLPQTQACIIGSTTANGGSLYYQSLFPWRVPTGRAQDYGVTAQTLDTIWVNTAGTFDGGKITPNTLTGVQIAPGSVPLSDLVSSQQSCLIAGTSTSNAYYEVPMGDWQIAVKRAQDNSPTGRTLDLIWANTAATFDGGKLTPNSVTTNQIKDSGTAFPVCMGSVNANASMNCSLNIQSISKNGTGLFKINFLLSIPNTNYICLPVINDGSGADAVTYEKATGYVVIRTMNQSAVNVDQGFDFEIKYIN
jgi:hypothetical protein